MKSVAQFEIPFHQYLNEHAEVQQTLPAFAQDPEHLLRLYCSILLTRTLDAKAVRMQRQGKMGTYPSSLGQEAVSTAMGDAMSEQDVLCPYYRDTGALLERGVLASEILAYWGGDERGSNFQGPREDFPISVPIATQCLHATGVAYAFKYRQQPRVAVTSIGEGGTSEGAFYEALNVAGAWQLPVVFVVNNNQWAISVPRSVQTHAQTIAQKAIAAGFDGVQVDGNDVIAVREVISNAIERARAGGGPTLVEAITYRLCDHTTADDARRYTNQADVDAAAKKEPLIRLHQYLSEQGTLTPKIDQEIHAQIKADVDAAVKTFEQHRKAPATDLFDYLYAELPESLLDQREMVEA